MLSQPKLHRLGASISKHGWDDAKATQWTCVELNASEIEEVYKANLRTSKLSKGGIVEPMKGGKYASFGGTHGNQWLRLLKHGGETTVKSLQVPGTNRIDTERIMARPRLREKVEKGNMWFVLNSEVESVWPGIIDFGQKALNTKAAVEQTDCEIIRVGWRAMPMDLNNIVKCTDALQR